MQINIEQIKPFAAVVIGVSSDTLVLSSPTLPDQFISSSILWLLSPSFTYGYINVKEANGGLLTVHNHFTHETVGHFSELYCMTTESLPLGTMVVASNANINIVSRQYHAGCYNSSIREIAEKAGIINIALPDIK